MALKLMGVTPRSCENPTPCFRLPVGGGPGMGHARLLGDAFEEHPLGGGGGVGRGTSRWPRWREVRGLGWNVETE